MFNIAIKKSLVRLKRPAECYEDAVLSGYRIIENESTIKTDSYLSYLYTKNVINRNNAGIPIRWSEAEDVIIKDPTSSVRYAQDIMLERWDSHIAEKTIAESLIWAPIYCQSFNISIIDLLSDADQDNVYVETLEKSIDCLISDVNILESEQLPHDLQDVFKFRTPIQVVQYLNSSYANHEYKNELCDLAKPFVLKSAYASYLYAKDIMGEPWLEGESVILTVPQAICEYCIRVKGSWPEGEKALLEFENAECCVDYACEILEERWKDAEDVIKTDPRQALAYAVNIVINYFWNDPALECEMIKLRKFSGNARSQLTIYATALAGFVDLETFMANNDLLVSELLKDDDTDLSSLDQE